jgi:hypothetical protein
LSRNGLKRTKEYRAFHPLQVGKGRWKTNKKPAPSRGLMIAALDAAL